MALVKHFEPGELFNPFEKLTTLGWIVTVVFWWVSYAILLNLTKNEDEEITLQELVREELLSTVQLFVVLKIAVYTAIMCWPSVILTGIMLSIILVILSFIYEIIPLLKPYQEFKHYIFSWIDIIFYDYSYQIINGPVPPNVYQLNFKYDNIYNCGICIDPFCKISHGDECILSCGHRYHSDCLRKWELEQFNKNPYHLYQCPSCRQSYNWHQKWNYTYTLTLY